MNPELLQTLIGNLSYGFQATGNTELFQAKLGLPDDGKFTIISTDDKGGQHRTPVNMDGVLQSEASADLGYHAVLLLGGQIYFGKMQITNGQRFIKMRDAHYLMPANTGRRDLLLVHTGQELHVPLDELTLNMAYVIHWQPLRDDSPLVRAILAAK